MNDVLNNGTAGSINDRAEGGEHAEEPVEMFPAGSLQGEGPTMQTIVKKGLPVTLEFSLSKAAVPNKGTGLFDPNKTGRALVTFVPGKLEPLPLREDDADELKVTGWKVIQNLRVTHVAGASDVASLVRDQFQMLAESDNAAAAQLHAQLGEIMESVLKETVAA